MGASKKLDELYGLCCEKIVDFHNVLIKVIDCYDQRDDYIMDFDGSDVVYIFITTRVFVIC